MMNFQLIMKNNSLSAFFVIASVHVLKVIQLTQEQLF